MATWNLRSFRGNPYLTVTAITMGTIVSSRTSASGVPAIFQLSASAVTATGSTLPYEDGEYRWEVTSGAEIGEHCVTLSWRNPIVNGVEQSTTIDTHTDQCGPEAVFRFFRAGTKTVRLTARFADGAGGYITDTATIDLTITAHAITNDRWYDADNGSASNDGLDPWGFAVTTGTLSGANVSTGLYEIISKDSNSQLTIRIADGDDRTLTKTDAFTAYDHTAATEPTDIVCRYNWVYLTAGTAAGGISTSTGPRKEALSTTPADDRTIHMRGGNTLAYTAPSPSALSGDTGSRFIAWGPDKARITKLSYSITSDPETATDHCWHRVYIDNEDESGDTGLYCVTTASTSPVDHLGWSDCDLLNIASQQAVIFTGAGTAATLGFCMWGGSVVTPNSLDTGVFLKGTWMSVFGTSISGSGTNVTLDHHIYPAMRGHFLCAYVTFGDGPNRNFCVNTDASGSDGVTRDYWNIRDCLITGTLRAWDASHGGNDENCFLRNFVAECNVITGLTGGGQVPPEHCHSMTLRDNVHYGCSDGGRWFEPVPTEQTASTFRVYYNKFHAAAAMASTGYFPANLSEAIPDCLFRDNEIIDERGTDLETLQCDFSAHDVAGNRLYTPNNAGTVVTNNAGGVNSQRTFAQYVSECDATALNTDPNWADPANGDFSELSIGSGWPFSIFLL